MCQVEATFIPAAINTFQMLPYWIQTIRQVILRTYGERKKESTASEEENGSGDTESADALSKERSRGAHATHDHRKELRAGLLR